MCGPASCLNALRALGIWETEDRLRNLTNATTAGVEGPVLVSALRECGLKADDYDGDNGKVSWAWLHGSLLFGKAAILCVDKWDHWVAAIGVLSDKVILFDSNKNSQPNRRENGVHHLGRNALLRRWVANEDGRKHYYGICVWR